MRVIEENYELQQPPQDLHRSDGLHLSDVIRPLAFKLNILDKRYASQEDVPSREKKQFYVTPIMQVGLAWENYLAKYQHPEIDFHPGELKLDGISMSPDGISIREDGDLFSQVGVSSYSKNHYVLDEFKFTRKSSRGFRDKLVTKHKKCLLWLWQVMAYRHAMNKIKMKCDGNLVRLNVFFVNGNYSWDDKDPESIPKPKRFRLIFEDQELIRNWRMITDFADCMGMYEGMVA